MDKSPYNPWIIPESSLDLSLIIPRVPLDDFLVIPRLSLSQDYPWIILGLSLDYPWIILELSWEYPRFSLNYLAYPFVILRFSHGYPFIIPVLSLDYPLIISDLSLASFGYLRLCLSSFKSGNSKLLLSETFFFLQPTGSIEELALLKSVM